MAYHGHGGYDPRCADMDFEKVEHAIKRLASWFRPLRAEQSEVLAEKLSRIPAEALDKIVGWLIEEHAPGSVFPTMAKLRDGYRRWASENPHKIIQPPRTTCRECGGDADTAGPGPGIIWFRYRDKDHNTGHWRESCVRCPSCENWRRITTASAMVARSRAQLEAAGCECWPWGESCRAGKLLDRRTQPTDLRDLAPQAARVMPDPDTPTDPEHAANVRRQALEMLDGGHRDLSPQGQQGTDNDLPEWQM